MSLRLKSGQTAKDAAFILLGDHRLENDVQIINGVAYIRGERAGPPARWAAAPPQERTK